jgi:DNA-directed RNA polymerase subunit M/transcription elongation factor TFIIS
MVKRCPKCSSLNVLSYAKSSEKYRCEDCGYLGPVINETDEFEDLGVDE